MFLEIFPLYNLQKTRSSKTRIEKKEIEWGYREDRRTDAEGTNGITQVKTTWRIQEETGKGTLETRIVYQQRQFSKTPLFSVCFSRELHI